MLAPMQYAPTESGEAGAPEYDDTHDRDECLREFNSRFRHAKDHWSEWRTEAKNLFDLKAGRQWDPADEAKMKDELRPFVTFNVSDKYNDVIVGLQINNRQEIRFFPRESGDAQVNEILTGSVNWGRDLCDAADDETDAFSDAIWTGMGWMEGYFDKDLELSGVPACQRVDNLEMYADPAARKRNLTDARYVIRIRDMDHDEYKELFGEYDEGGAADDLISMHDDEGDVELIEEPQDYRDDSRAEAAPKKGKCQVADYQYWKREERYILNHPQFGQNELTKAEYDAYEQSKFFKRAAAAGHRISTQKIRRKVYYRAFISKGRIAKGKKGFGLSPYQGGFTYHAITGKRDRNKNTWYGIGRGITDVQKWLNKFFSTILYAMMTNAKGGIMAEENSFKDARKAESEWANPQSITWMKAGAIAGAQGPKVIPKPPAAYPQGLDRLMEFTVNALPQVMGMNPEILGLADKVQAGVVEAQRKQSAMAVIAWAFDAMRRYYRSMGRQMAQYVVDYVPEGTLVLINGEMAKQYVPIIKQQLPMRFDVIVDEAPTSVNQQERVWLVLEQMIPQLLQAGIPVTPKVLDYSPLPADLVAEWKKLLQGDPQKAELQKRAEAANVQKVESEVQKNASQAQLNVAKAAELGQKPANVQADTSLKQMQALKTAAEAGAAQAGASSRGSTS